MLEISFLHYMQQGCFNPCRCVAREKSYSISMETKEISCLNGLLASKYFQILECMGFYILVKPEPSSEGLHVYGNPGSSTEGK
jgi:hypothetical protein